MADDENDWKPFDIGYQMWENSVETWGSCAAFQVLYLSVRDFKT